MGFTMSNNTERIVGKLGKLEAKIPVGLKALAEYQASPFPAAPAQVKVPNISNWQMLGNDQYGDCTFAGIAHAKMSTAKVLGINETVPTAQKVVQAYLAYTNGQDGGAVEADLLKYWLTNKILGTTLSGYAPANINDYEEIKNVIAHYGLAYIGIRVPALCQQQFEQHEPWTLSHTAADDNIIGGHCIILVGYDKDYIYGITWGAVQKIEWSWLQKYMDEAWALITPEIAIRGAYDNIKLADLKADLSKL